MSENVNQKLLASLKETRDVCAAMTRAIVNAGVTDKVMVLMPERFNGFGVRANEAIKAAETELARRGDINGTKSSQQEN